MSGGAYGYAYFEAEQVRRTLETMLEDIGDDEDVPDEAVATVADIVRTIEGNEELLRAIEWYESGDSGPAAIEAEL